MADHLPPPDPTTILPPGAPAPRASRGVPRWLRVVAPVGIVAVALGGFAVAQAATDDSGNDSPRDLIERTTTSSTLPDGTPEVGDDRGGLRGGTVQETATFIDGAIADGATQSFAAGAAGTVTISRSGATLTVVSAVANPGWIAVIEAGSGPEVEVEFAGAGARIDLEAEIEDGGVRVRVRERTVVADPGAADPTPTRVDSSGPGSIDDDHTDDDHRGPGSGSDDAPDDDHRGPGSGSDDAPDVDDDHRGSGSDDAPDLDEDDEDDDHRGSGSSGSGSSGSGSDD